MPSFLRRLEEALGSDARCAWERATAAREGVCALGERATAAGREGVRRVQERATAAGEGVCTLGERATAAGREGVRCVQERVTAVREGVRALSGRARSDLSGATEGSLALVATEIPRRNRMFDNFYDADVGVEIDTDPLAWEPGPHGVRRTYGKERPLRVLCLHGHGSNNQITRMQMASLNFGQWVEFDFLHGPFVVEADPSLQTFSQGPFYTWFAALTPPGIAQTLRYVVHYLREHGPYAGMFGFSMGAAVVSTLSLPGMLVTLGVSLQQHQPWHFTVCAGGVNFGVATAVEALKALEYGDVDEDMAVQTVYALLHGRDPKDAGIPQIELASLHIIGKEDSFRSFSYNLASMYGAPLIYEHAFGHELPGALCRDAAMMSNMKDFFTRVECRIADDGEAYNYEQFMDFYGDDGPSRWQAAELFSSRHL